MDFFNQLGFEGGNRTRSESPIVYCANLVDEKIGIFCKFFSRLDPDAERFRIGDEICRQRDDNRRGMSRIQKSLILEMRTGLVFPGSVPLPGFRLANQIVP